MTMELSTRRTARGRRILAALVTAVAMIATQIPAAPAHAVTTGNGALVYSPAAGTSFNPEGGRAAGTTYSKMIVLKNSGTSNGTQLVTFDQLVLENGVQVYPIYRSTNNGTSWTRIAAVKPSTQFPTLTRTAQPSLYETPIQLGNLHAHRPVQQPSGDVQEPRQGSHLVVLEHCRYWRARNLRPLPHIDHLHSMGTVGRC
jgi:hypothetical protein